MSAGLPQLEQLFLKEDAFCSASVQVPSSVLILLLS